VDEPIVQHCGFILNAHFELIVLQNLNKVTHDVREEGDAAKHDNDSHNSLSIANWVEITISNCT
jgi:hypothetical protein